MTRRVVHVITGLDLGGAERMLVKLALASRTATAQRVVSLRTRGVLADELEAAGIPVVALELRGVRDLHGGSVRLAALLREWQPDVVHAWMYHAHLVAGWAAARAGIPGVIWNVRANRITMDVEKPGTVLLARGAALLARRWARRIVCNSDAAIAVHAGWGYPRDRMLRIDNGFDEASSHPAPAAVAAWRRRIGIGPDVPLVGMLGRLSPIKGHVNFVSAAERVAQARPDVHFVLAGPGVDTAGSVLDAACAAPALAGRMHRFGAVAPASDYLGALSLFVLPSVDEAFPNVLGEAMACGLACVATDVGDCRHVLGGHGGIVPARDPSALATAIIDMLARSAAERDALGAAAQARIRRHFSLDAVVARYLALYDEVAA